MTPKTADYIPKILTIPLFRASSGMYSTRTTEITPFPNFNPKLIKNHKFNFLENCSEWHKNVCTHKKNLMKNQNVCNCAPI